MTKPIIVVKMLCELYHSSERIFNKGFTFLALYYIILIT